MAMTADVSIRQAISEQLTDNGLSDREFARQLGVSHNWVHRHLRADPPASFAVADVERIAAALDVPIHQLLPPVTDPDLGLRRVGGAA